MTMPRELIVDGQAGSISEWARRLGITRPAMVARVRKLLAPRDGQCCSECDARNHNARTCKAAKR